MLTRILLAAAAAALVAAAMVPEAAAEDGRAVDMTTALHDEFGRPAKDMLEQAKDDPDCARCPLVPVCRQMPQLRKEKPGSRLPPDGNSYAPARAPA